MNPTKSAPAYVPFRIHPITDRTYWQAAAKHPKVSQMLADLDDATPPLPDKPAHPTATDFLAAKRSNDRAILDHYWRDTRRVLANQVVQRCLDGATDTGVDDRLLNTLWSFLTAPTWVVSAHLPKNDLPLLSAPQLDLAACEMAAVLAETLEALKPWIDNQSQTLANSIIEEIDRRVLTPFVTGTHAWWYDPKAAHVNNWTGVCAGTILAACESLAAIGQPRPLARKKALDFLNYFLKNGFTPAGECDEGVGYWNYGVGFACIGWSRLSEDEFRQTVDLERLKVVADYPRQVHLFDNFFFSGNDASLKGGAPLYASVWLAGATGSQWILNWASGTKIGALGLRDPCVVLRTVDALLSLDGVPSTLPTPPASRFIPDQQGAIFQDGSLLIYFAGGNNAEAHNHNDIGHFCLWHDHKLIIPDLGAPHYTADFFGPGRYEYLSASSRGHCCPIINGLAQIPGKQAQAKTLSVDLDSRQCAFDMTSAYPPEAKLTKWTRALSVKNQTGEFVDEFVTSEPVTIENVVWSVLKPERRDNTVTCGPVTLSFDSGVDLTIEAIDPKAHGLRDYAEPLYRIGFTLPKTVANVPTRFTLSIR